MRLYQVPKSRCCMAAPPQSALMPSAGQRLRRGGKIGGAAVVGRRLSSNSWLLRPGGQSIAVAADPRPLGHRTPPCVSVSSPSRSPIPSSTPRPSTRGINRTAAPIHHEPMQKPAVALPSIQAQPPKPASPPPSFPLITRTLLHPPSPPTQPQHPNQPKPNQRLAQQTQQPQKRHQKRKSDVTVPLLSSPSMRQPRPEAERKNTREIPQTYPHAETPTPQKCRLYDLRPSEHPAQSVVEGNPSVHRSLREAPTHLSFRFRACTVRGEEEKSPSRPADRRTRQCCRIARQV